MSGVALFVSVFVAALQSGPADSLDALRRAAERTARVYERAIHDAAPRRFDGGGGGRCDEVIGRFCFRFDGSDELSLPSPDPADVVGARERAITAYRGWFAADPADFSPAAALVRYLLESDRPEEAIAAGRAHVHFAGGGFRSHLLLGLALHQSGDVPAAEAAFDSALAAAPPDTALALASLDLLLSREERSLYSRLGDAERRQYHERVWALADPAWSEPGNERRSAHFARHTWIRILGDRERVRGMLRWGRDHEEIVLRYGLPVRRERALPIYGSLLDDSLIEHFDSRSLALMPVSLMTEGYPGVPEPGSAWLMRADSARVSYAPLQPPGVRRLIGGIPHQASRFPRLRTVLLRVDGAVAPDSVGGPAPRSSRAVLVVRDTLGRELARSVGVVEPSDRDTLRVMAEAELPAGTHVYSLEVVDDSAGLIALARYRVDLRAAPALGLSDIVVAEPARSDPARANAADALDAPDAQETPHPADAPAAALRPYATLEFAAGATVDLYARATGLLLEGGPGGPSRYAVEWWMEAAEPGSLVGRAARWLGRRLGLVDSRPPVRVRWEEAGTGPEAPIRLAFTFPQDGRGLYRINLRVTDRLSGRSLAASRLVLLEEASGGG